MIFRILSFAAIFCSISYQPLNARSVEIAAEAVATIQNAGARGEPEGFRFFNVIGGGSRFASFGIIEIDLSPAQRLSLSNETKVRLILTQRNANFSREGSFSVHLAGGGLDESIFPGSSSFQFDVQQGVGGIDLAALDYPVWEVGRGSFEVCESGHRDEIVLNFSDLQSPESRYLQNALTERSRIRLLVLAEDDATAATWSGVEPSRNFAPPAIVFDN